MRPFNHLFALHLPHIVRPFDTHTAIEFIVHGALDPDYYECVRLDWDPSICLNLAASGTANRPELKEYENNKNKHNSSHCLYIVLIK